MIGLIKGSVEEKSLESVIVMVQGVGYEVFLGPRALDQMAVGDAIALHIYTFVREDVIALYGFTDVSQKRLFLLLLQVQGVGAKTALLIVDRGVSEVQNAISNADVTFFTTIPRVGKKSAQKIIIELKNKLGSVAELDLSGAQVSGDTQDVLDALVNMGLSKPEAYEAIQALPTDLNTVTEKVSYALKLMGRTKS